MPDREEIMQKSTAQKEGSQERGDSGVESDVEHLATSETQENNIDEDLMTELVKAQEKVSELEEKMLRLAAEFDNSRKRAQRQHEITLKYAGEGIFKELLPSIDNLERAIEQGHNGDDAAALLEGVELTCKSLLAVLEKFGLTPLAGAGEAFDPNFHEALAMEASSEIAENMILQEFQKGYMYKDRLLRAAKVVVSKGEE